MSLLHITSDSPVVETENAIVLLKLEEALCKQAVRPELAKPGSNSKAFPHTPSAGPFSIPHLQGLSPYPISRAFPPSASLLDLKSRFHSGAVSTPTPIYACAHSCSMQLANSVLRVLQLLQTTFTGLLYIAAPVLTYSPLKACTMAFAACGSSLSTGMVTSLH